MNQAKQLEHLADSKEERIALAHILEQYERSRQRNVPIYTGFLSPAQQTAARTLLQGCGARAEELLFWGGYEGAERKLLCFLPDWMSEPEAELRLLECAYPMHPKLSHRDLLGSLMAMGITRERLGDILVQEERAQVLVLGETADWLLENWRSAGTARFTPQEVPLSELHPPALRVREIRDTVATLRLDAVLASGFSTSRSRAAELISAGRVQVNHRDCTKSDRLLCEGDILTVRGLGKCQLAAVGGLSKKGRIGLLLKRFE